MLEQADLDQALPKEEYQRRLPQLQQRLYNLEHALFTANIPTLLVFEGWAAAGKGGAINTLTEHLDPRGFRVVPITPPRTYETRYPWMWRFWQKIPANGQIAIFDQSWYRRVLIERVNKVIRKREWQAAFQDIAEFEEMLAADGAVIVKFWLHISQKEQARRFKKLLKDRLTAWQVTDEDAAQHANYNRYVKAVEAMLLRTDAPHAPWVIVPATDRYFARLSLLDAIIRTLENRLGDQAPPAEARSTADQEAAHA
jgi:polyphosphate kinase 2 (PPK2 family)